MSIPSWERVTGEPNIPDDECIIETADKIKFKIKKTLLERSKLVKDLLEAASDTPNVTLPVSEVTSDTMERVFEWLYHNVANTPTKVPRPLRKPLNEYVTPYEWTYLTTRCLEAGDETKHLNLLLVLKAANFLGILELRELTTAMLAHMLKGKDMDQLHVLFQEELKGRKLGPADFEKLYQKFEWMREPGTAPK
eukprot:PhF_6_TR39068/c0_g1_i1/m.58466/K03094/SKP1, CBF3D; S-phase kinase-associated protein 1